MMHKSTFIKQIDSSRFQVTLVDRDNYHCFPPLFYQVASSGLDPTDISFPFRREMRHSTDDGSRFHMGIVSSVDVSAKTVTTDTGEVPYDILVVAMGTTNNFFGNPALIDEVYTLKSADEAIRIRNEILHRCELAAVAKTRAEQRDLLSFAVIGGGPAGVEIAGRGHRQAAADDEREGLGECAKEPRRAYGRGASRQADEEL